MAIVTKSRTYLTGNNLTASNYNDDRDEMINGINSINNSQIASDAGIEASKISGTAVTLAGTETLSNKTLTTPTLTKPTVTGSVQTLVTDSDGATITFDLDTSNIHSVTLAGNRTLALSNPDIGQAFVIRLIQDATGSRTVTWFSGISWVESAVPLLSSGANKIDSFGFICTGSGAYDGYIIGQNLG